MEFLVFLARRFDLVVVFRALKAPRGVRLVFHPTKLFIRTSIFDLQLNVY